MLTPATLIFKHRLEQLEVGVNVIPLVDEGLGNSAYVVETHLHADFVSGGRELVATPGHTPEHLAYLLRDDGRTVALFSGGTLMAGGVARPDLLSAEQTELLARAAYRSIHQRLLTLPDDLAVHPSHGGGSFCSVAGGGERTTTIGFDQLVGELAGGVAAWQDAGRPLATTPLVHCGHGERAMSAASLLQ
ncbi:MAG: hypothetical protein WEB09_09820, partial [Nitriliruptor sp.]